MVRKPTYGELEQRVKELRVNEERINLILEGTDEGTWDWDVVNGDITLDDNWTRILGYETGEMNFDFDWWNKSIHPDSKPVFEKALNAYLEGREKYYELEYQMRTKSGEWRWIWTRGICIAYDNRGKPLNFIGTHRDITDRKQAEEALKKAHEELEEKVKKRTEDLMNAKEKLEFSHRLLQIANRNRAMKSVLEEFIAEIKNFTRCEAIGIRILDEEGNIPYKAYEGFSKWFYESESPLSIKSDQCMCINVVKGNPDPKLPFFTEYGSFYMNGTTRFLATVSEEDKGQTRNVCNQVGYESVALIPIKMGDLILGLIHIADPHENMVPIEMVKVVEEAAMYHGTAIQRISAEEALRDSEEKYRTLTENIPDIIYSFDKDGKIITINPQAEELFGYQSKEMIGNHISAFVYPQDKDMYLKTLMKGVKNHQKHIRGLEFGIVDKSGATRWVEMHSRNQFDEHGNFLQQDGVLRDITETKLLQDQLIRSERLAATGQLATSIAHEINSPLQGITSLIGVIKESYDKDAELLENIELIEGGFKRIRDTVKKLLDLNRPGKEQKQSININAVINDTLSLVEVLLKKNKINVDLNLSSRVPDIVASPQQLSQVFMNLINNAVESMTGDHKGEGWKERTAVGGEIRINTRLRKEEVIIEVADTGPGISKKDMQNIFDPFYTRKKTMGMGVGLSISHGIIEDHKGSIVIKNLPAGGAVFKITLPVN